MSIKDEISGTQQGVQWCLCVILCIEESSSFETSWKDRLIHLLNQDK